MSILNRSFSYLRRSCLNAIDDIIGSVKLQGLLESDAFKNNYLPVLEMMLKSFSVNGSDIDAVQRIAQLWGVLHPNQDANNASTSSSSQQQFLDQIDFSSFSSLLIGGSGADDNSSSRLIEFHDGDSSSSSDDDYDWHETKTKFSTSSDDDSYDDGSGVGILKIINDSSSGDEFGSDDGTLTYLLSKDPDSDDDE